MRSTRDEDIIRLHTGIPKEIFQDLISFCDPNHDYLSAPVTSVLVSLSATCTSMHTFFKTDLDNRKLLAAAQTALRVTLQGDEETVVKLAMLNPESFLVEATCTDFAMDLEGNQRIIRSWSAYQAMFGTCDIAMIKKVKPILMEKIPDFHERACRQEQEKFPYGFLFPRCTFDFEPLMRAITNDPGLTSLNYSPSKSTLTVLAEFQMHFKPYDVTWGYHFNLDTFVAAHELYDEIFDLWNENQRAFFSGYVIGFLERLLSGAYMQRACMGKKSNPPERNYILRDFEYGRKPTFAIFPQYNRTHHDCRLGNGCYVDFANFARIFNSQHFSFVFKGRTPILQQHVEEIEQELRNLSAQPIAENNFIYEIS